MTETRAGNSEASKDRQGLSKEEGRQHAPGRPCRQFAPHLFLPLVSHFLEQLHYLLDDDILWKKTNTPG